MSNKLIPLFDSLTHPTLNKKWIKNENADIDYLIESMRKNSVIAAIAVGMKGIGDYHEDRFITLVGKYKELIPVAFFDSFNFPDKSIKINLINLKSKGFMGIKIHPRISELSLRDPKLAKVIEFASEIGLFVLFCTYFIDSKNYSLDNDISALRYLLSKTKKPKIILLHSGTTNLLEVIDIARSYENVLLDLSFTMIKYQGSSLDLDIKYAFQYFDRRVCIGSDHPEFNHFELRARFEFFSDGLSVEKKENIAFKNLYEFIRGFNKNFNLEKIND